MSTAKKKLMFKMRHAIAVAILILVMLMVVALARVFFKDHAVKKEIARLKQETQQLENKKLQSLELLDYIATDTYIEEQARAKLGFTKEGEKVVVFNETSEDDIKSSAVLQNARLTNKQQWWYYFFAPEKL